MLIVFLFFVKIYFMLRWKYVLNLVGDQECKTSVRKQGLNKE
jgi:hypothetical protein